LRASRRTAIGEIVPASILRDAMLRMAPQDEVRSGAYFNAELLQVTHRMSCPAPRRNSTATKPLDRLSTRRRGSPSASSSEAVPVPVRPQWGQQSETAQAVNALIV
jgi:hypothetical protein